MGSIVLTGEDAAVFIKQHYEKLKRFETQNNVMNEKRNVLINHYKEVKKI